MYLGSFLLCERLSEVTAKHSRLLLLKVVCQSVCL